MSIFGIIALTLGIYWIVGTVVFILSGQDEKVGTIWAMGLVYPILWVLCYPIRAWNGWQSMRAYYIQRGIPFWKYLLGKRLKKRKEKHNDED